MSQRSIVVVSAGLRQPSSTRLLGDRLVTAVVDDLAERGLQPTGTVIELREHAHDLTNSLLTGFPVGGLRDVLDTVLAADGLIAVTPIFNASYSGLFKSFFDVFEAGALEGKPVLAAATGGTARHSLALEHAVRPLFAHLRAAVVPTAVFAAPEDWGASPSSTTERSTTESGLRERLHQAARELAEAVARQPRQVPRDPYDDPTPFADLLG